MPINDEDKKCPALLLGKTYSPLIKRAICFVEKRVCCSTSDPSPIPVGQFWVGFFLVLEEGRDALIHLLLRDFGGECFFASALAAHCRRIVEDLQAEQ